MGKGSDLPVELKKKKALTLIDGTPPDDKKKAGLGQW